MVVRVRFIVSTMLVLAFGLAGACGGESVTPSATCSDAPRWPRGTRFEYERGGPSDAPACTPHCGPNAHASPMWGGAGGLNALTSDALPSGACDENGVACTMKAEWLGPCPPDGQPVGPLDLFICRCSGGRWSCTVDATSPSATSWSCMMPDGSDFNHPGDAGAHDAGDG